MLRGGLWNTMVIVFKLKTLIEYIRAVSARTHRRIEQIYQAADSATFEKVVKQVFAQAESFNLSSGFLQMLPLQRERDLVVLPVRGVHWSDWGSEARIMETFKLTENGKCGLESSGALFTSPLGRSVAGSN